MSGYAEITDLVSQWQLQYVSIHNKFSQPAHIMCRLITIIR